jgi:hypothetical protein
MATFNDTTRAFSLLGEILAVATLIVGGASSPASPRWSEGGRDDEHLTSFSRGRACRCAFRGGCRHSRPPVAETVSPRIAILREQHDAA